MSLLSPRCQQQRSPTTRWLLFQLCNACEVAKCVVWFSKDDWKTFLFLDLYTDISIQQAATRLLFLALFCQSWLHQPNIVQFPLHPNLWSPFRPFADSLWYHESAWPMGQSHQMMMTVAIASRLVACCDPGGPSVVPGVLYAYAYPHVPTAQRHSK